MGTDATCVRVDSTFWKWHVSSVLSSYTSLVLCFDATLAMGPAVYTESPHSADDYIIFCANGSELLVLLYGRFCTIFARMVAVYL